MNYIMYKIHYITTVAGFEPARTMCNGFQVHLLNHSDILSDPKTNYFGFQVASGLEPETFTLQV